MNDLEDLSCTDITQQWGKIKKQTRDMYEVVPTSKFCHGQNTRPCPYNGRYGPQKKTPGLISELRHILLSGSQDSALALHLGNSRTKEYTAVEVPSRCPAEELRAFATEMCISNAPLLVASNTADHAILCLCKEEEIRFYRENVSVTAGEAVDICLATTAQVGAIWHSQRKLRITGSRCYELYTYSLPGNVSRNWESKLNGIVFSSFVGNAHTSYGILNEPNAISAYTRQTDTAVTDLGIVINHHAPWLGYSPDGVVLDSNRLIEVKCLAEGKTLGGLEMAKKISCVVVDGDGRVSLKKRHKYYGQIQLGMLLTGCKECDFVLYSKAQDENVIVPVEFDEPFAEKMLTVLRVTYFNKMLPFLIMNSHKLKNLPAAQT